MFISNESAQGLLETRDPKFALGIVGHKRMVIDYRRL
jgi:hypothetical protein